MGHDVNQNRRAGGDRLRWAWYLWLMRWVVILLLCGCTGTLDNNHPGDSAAGGDTDIGDDAPAPAEPCPPLPAPSGNIITIAPAQTSQLQSTVTGLAAGDTVLLQDGVYNLNGDFLWITAPEVTIRSQSGDREAVVLDGDYAMTSIVNIRASNVTIADITIRESYYHPIHISPASADILGTSIYNVHIIDPGEQAIKINPDGTQTLFCDEGVIACSHIEMTAAGRSQVRNNCYTGGVDAHRARNWQVRDNRIEGFWCALGLSEHAVHFWRGGRDTLVERNVMINNARGVGFGLGALGGGRTYPDDPCPGGTEVGHFDGRIRNNIVFADDASLFASEYGFDAGIALEQACGAQVFHNTVVSTQAPFSSIEWRFDSTDADIRNNLASHNLRDRGDGATATLAGNLESAPMSLFASVNADLRLAPSAAAAIDQGVVLSAGACDEDIDGEVRDTAPDIGSDEYR